MSVNGLKLSGRNMVNLPAPTGVSMASTIRLFGLDCADCAAKLEKKLLSSPGVERVAINFGAAKMTVHHSIPVQSVLTLLETHGYGGQVETGVQREAAPSLWVNRCTVLTVISGCALAGGFLASLLGVGTGTVRLLFLLAMLTGGFHPARRALYALRAFSLDMNFLMTAAAIGAVAIGEWAEGATVVFLFSLGNTLQTYAMDRTRRSIRSLMDLSPPDALVRRGGKEIRLPVEDIRVGDVILVKPGERIALDGLVVEGSSGVNQAPITGESLPVLKKPGDEVFAGTINERGFLAIQVTRLVEDTTLAKIMHLVEEAQVQKAPSQQFVDVFARYYTPAVILVAVALAAIPPFLGMPFDEWFYRALVLLVIACPCALVISTPVSIVSAIGNAARNGVLIKGGVYLEALGSLRAMAFDKTGTLTVGKPVVTDVVSLGDRTVQDIVRLAAGIEKKSQHPLGEAVVRYASDLGLDGLEMDGFEAITSRGVKAVWKGIDYYIGSAQLFSELGVEISSSASVMERLSEMGRTVILVGTGREVLGVIAVADAIRPASKTALRELRRVGVKKLVMLTGDNRTVAQNVASELELDDFRAEVLPQNKMDTVIKLIKEHGGVGMVGDGVNDAPALAAATVGIAMGVAGTDTALETADIALMGDDLTKLPYAISLGRRALGIIKQNILFALVTKLAFLVLTFFGLTTLWMAVFADTGAALLVIANGLRLMAGTPAPLSPVGEHSTQ